MEKDNIGKTTSEQEGAEVPSSAAADKKPWAPPKLAFVKPKLIKHGNLQEVTGQEGDGFFGGFTT
jgi:hypothetical protein